MPITHTQSYPLAQGHLQLIALCPWLKCQVHIWRHESFPMTGSGKMLKHETLGDSWPLATGHWHLRHWPHHGSHVANGRCPLPLSLNLEALPALPRGSEPSRLRRAGAYEDSQALCHQGSSSLVLRIAATSNSTLFYSESLDTGHLCFFIVLHCFNFFAAGGT